MTKPEINVTLKTTRTLWKTQVKVFSTSYELYRKHIENKFGCLVQAYNLRIDTSVITIYGILTYTIDITSDLPTFTLVEGMTLEQACV